MQQEEQFIEVETGAPVMASVIWLHGLGADGYDFEPIVPELGLPPTTGVRFIFPHAPHRPVTLNAGYVMRAWYDIVAIDTDARQDAEGIRESEKLIQDLIEREQARGIPYRRILLAGFSQGGAVALHTALRFSGRLGGVIALSTYLPLHDLVEAEAHPANAQIPIFMAHGVDDGIVPYELGEISRDHLRAVGAEVDWHVYSIAHAVSPEEIADIGEWLQERLQRPV